MYKKENTKKKLKTRNVSFNDEDSPSSGPIKFNL